MKKKSAKKAPEHISRKREALRAALAILSHDLGEGGPCPEPEDLAAFSEGKVRGKKRNAILSHLAQCPECRHQIFITQSVLDEMAPGDEDV